MELKKCSNKNCLNPLKPKSDFCKNSKMDDGLQSWCKDCKRVADKKVKSTLHAKEVDKQYKNSKAKFETYESKLIKFHEIRNNNNLLEVRCKLCNEFFTPTNLQVSDRIRSIEGTKTGNFTECNFYCSNKCKNNCILYHKKTNQVTSTKNRGTSVDQNQFRKIVFEKLPNKCYYCDITNNLIIHHIIPVKLEEMYMFDIDNVILVCKDHHKQTHKIDGCGLGQLRNCIQR